MGNAIWLLVSLPEWFFSVLVSPMDGGIITAVPMIGIACLLVGLVLAIAKRDRLLLIFVTPPLLSEALVGIAGGLRGRVTSTVSSPVLLVFLGVQLTLCIYLTYRVRGSRAAGAAFAVFSFAYALFAAFVAAMAFADEWI